MRGYCVSVSGLVRPKFLSSFWLGPSLQSMACAIRDIGDGSGQGAVLLNYHYQGQLIYKSRFI